jgi:mannosyltransferase OCH1-like enzyme
MKIPKIIHQTWKTRRLPKGMQSLMDTWKQYHPDWEHIFWTDSDNRKFVQRNFPALLKTYDSFETNIQRADAIRYLLLYKLGGVYVDIDFECFKNLEDLLKDKSCVLSKEPVGHCLMHGIDDLVCNAFMASVPQHPFMGLIIEEIGLGGQGNLNRNDLVMDSTGPYMVTRVFRKYAGEMDLTILEPELVYPLTRPEVVKLLLGGEYDAILQEKLNNSVAVHYWLNTWVDFNAELKRRSK